MFFTICFNTRLGPRGKKVSRCQFLAVATKMSLINEYAVESPNSKKPLNCKKKKSDDTDHFITSILFVCLFTSSRALFYEACQGLIKTVM